MVHGYINHYQWLKITILLS